MKLSVLVKPGKKKTEILSQEGNTYTIALKSRPEKGEANKELVKFLTKELKKDVRIVSGFSSRRKIVEVNSP